MTETVADFQNVCKDYVSGLWRKRTIHAVRDISLRVKPGEVFGLLGPNRAGKTTLVKMLLSLSRPTSGTVLRLGQPLEDRSTLGRIGYMHENHAFPRYLTATDVLFFYGALTLLPEADLGKRVPELLKRVGLADRAQEPIANFSKGMIQRLGLAQALLNDPELLVLDEPTEGLDLAGRRLLREVVNDLRERGRTVLLISHVMTEVEQLCTRLAVVVEGRIRRVGSMDEVKGDAPTLEAALQTIYEQGEP